MIIGAGIAAGRYGAATFVLTPMPHPLPQRTETPFSDPTPDAQRAIAVPSG